MRFAEMGKSGKVRRYLLSLVLILGVSAAWVYYRGQGIAASGDNGSSHDETVVFDGEVIRLSWFYKPPRASELALLPAHFDQFILTRNDEAERDVLRAQGADGPFLQYLRLDAIHNPGACAEQPWRNQVADRIGDFCRISAQYPDWFLLDLNGRRIEHDGYVMMDPGHPGWRAFWLERARQSQEELGWDGVFLDNVEASLSKRLQRGSLPARYPDDASYQAAIESFLAYLYTTYFEPEARPLYANIIALQDTAVWFRYLQYLDGVMEERFAVDWSDGYLGDPEWQEQMARFEQTQNQGKELILVAQGAYLDMFRQQFAFASYLLVNQGRASFRYARHTDYQEVWLYENYALDLGAPLGPRYLDGEVWRRDFARGTVTLDPVTHTAQIATR